MEGISQCTPTVPSDQMLTLMQKAYSFHTRKAVESIESTFSMMVVPTPFIKHTPLMICGLAMAIMSQLSACDNVLQASKLDEARERIRLGLGVLKAFV